MIFEKITKPKVGQRPLDSIKSIDSMKFPPCQKVLHQQIKRAWYIARIYKTSTEAYPAFEYTPIDFGWQLSQCREYMEIKWFDGDQTPMELESREEEQDRNMNVDDESEVEEIESDDDDDESDSDIEL